MRHPLLIFAFMSLFLNRIYASESTVDFTFIDNYLSRWDRFAQGDDQLVPSLRDDKARFLTELASAVSSGDKRAMSRVVFYAVVRVGGFDYDTPLGKAVEKVVSPEIQVSTDAGNDKTYYAGDLYFWWEKHKKEYESYPLYDEYLKRDFAQKTVIPMYTAAAKNSSH